MNVPSTCSTRMKVCHSLSLSFCRLVTMDGECIVGGINLKFSTVPFLLTLTLTLTTNYPAPCTLGKSVCQNCPAGFYTDGLDKQTHCWAYPTGYPTGQPTGVPTTQPTMQPTTQPTAQPTGQPTGQPTTQPTGQPTGQPTMQPTMRPTGQPTSVPSSQPSSMPSGQPTSQPTTPTGKVSFPTSISATHCNYDVMMGILIQPLLSLALPPTIILQVNPPQHLLRRYSKCLVVILSMLLEQIRRRSR